MDSIRKLLGANEVEAPDGMTIRWAQKHLEVVFRSGRSHRVRYRQAAAHLTFRATVATARVVDAIGYARLAREVLLRNRVAECVGFRITPGGRLEALIQQRASTLDRQELLYYVCQLAREADRLEYLLTGRDVH